MVTPHFFTNISIKIIQYFVKLKVIFPYLENKDRFEIQAEMMQRIYFSAESQNKIER